MRKILIPTDFSDNAYNALKYACELFKYEIGELFILHAYQDEVYAHDSLVSRDLLDEVTKTVAKHSEQQLDAVLQKVKKEFPNPRHTYKTIAANSTLIDEVDKIVDEENVDCIVMGTRGKTNDRKLTFGSHTLQVLRYVQCPVLAIPENYKYTQPKHILFPTNYLIPYKRRELKFLCELAAPFRTKIDIAYVSKSDKLSLRQEDNQKFLEEELCKNKPEFITIFNNNITDAIYNYVNDNSVDLLVMVNTRHSFLENILFQTTIDKISLNIDIPFLALQNIKRY